MMIKETQEEKKISRVLKANRRAFTSSLNAKQLLAFHIVIRDIKQLEHLFYKRLYNDN